MAFPEDPNCRPHPGMMLLARVSETLYADRRIVASRRRSFVCSDCPLLKDRSNVKGSGF